MSKMEEKLWDLQNRIIDKGRELRDRRTWKDIKSEAVFEAVLDMSRDLREQIKRDTRAGYKFWDSLAMLCGQEKYWDKEDKEILLYIANMYIEGGIK